MRGADGRFMKGGGGGSGGGISAGDIVYHITGEMSGLQGAMTESQNMAKGFGASFMEHSRAIGIGMTAIGAGITAPLVLGVRSAGEFGSAMAKVAALGTEHMDVLTDSVRTTAVAYGIDLVEAAVATEKAISSGADSFTAPKILEDSAIAAAAGQTELTTAIEFGMGMANAFGIELTDLNKIFDVGFIGVNKGVMTFEELAAAAGRAAPAFAANKIPLEELIGASAALTLGGVKASEAFTQLNAVVTGFTRNGQSAQLETLGLQGALKWLQEQTEGNKEKMLGFLGSTEAMAAMLALTGNQAESFTAIMDEMKNSAGASKEAFDIIAASDPTFAWKLLRSAMQDLAITVGQALLPALGDIVRTVTPWIKSIAEWMKEHESLTVAIISTAASVGTLSLALGPLLISLASLKLLFGAGGLAAGATATSNAITGMGTAASIAGGAGGVGGLGIALAGLAGIIIPVAIALEIATIGMALWETKKAYDQLHESTIKANKSDQQYMASLKSSGAVFNERAAAMMGNAEKAAYLGDAEKTAADVSARAWFEHYRGREESETEFARMRNLMLNKEVSAREAALATIANMNDKDMETLMKADKNQTEAILLGLQIRTDATLTSSMTVTKAEQDAASERNENWMDMTHLFVQTEQQKAEQVQGFWASVWNNIVSLFSQPLPNTGFQDLNAALTAASPEYATAAGGPAYKGVPTIMNERGQEVFVPRVDGRILTHNQTAAMMQSGGGTNNISISINASIANDYDVSRMAQQLGEKLRHKLTGIGATGTWRTA